STALVICVLYLFFFFQAEDGIRDGHVTGVQTCALPIFGDVQGFLLDVTERAQALEGLQRSEERFRTLLSNIPGAIYRGSLDSNWDMEFISENIQTISGYPASDFVLSAVRTFASIIHRDDQAGAEEGVDDALSRHEPFVLEYRTIRSDGTIRWVHEKGQGLRDERDEGM